MVQRRPSAGRGAAPSEPRQGPRLLPTSAYDSGKSFAASSLMPQTMCWSHFHVKTKIERNLRVDSAGAAVHAQKNLRLMFERRGAAAGAFTICLQRPVCHAACCNKHASLHSHARGRMHQGPWRRAHMHPHRSPQCCTKRWHGNCHLVIGQASTPWTPKPLHRSLLPAGQPLFPSGAAIHGHSLAVVPIHQLQKSPSGLQGCSALSPLRNRRPHRLIHHRRGDAQ